MTTHFVVVVTAYNCENYVEKVISSIGSQKYANFEIIFIDDASTDNTYAKAKCLALNNIHLHQNSSRQGRISNIVKAVSTCNEKSVIVLVDGDDFLAGPEVLSKLNEVYTTKDVWMTVGGHVVDPPMDYPPVKYNLYYSAANDQKRNYRDTIWTQPHLLSFRASLFWKINDKDMRNEDGTYITVATDCAMVWPMLEMSNGRYYSFVGEVLYKYNTVNPLSLHSKEERRREQVEMEQQLRKMKRYPPLDSL